MAAASWTELVRCLTQGTISRRDFVTRAIASGASAGAIAAVLANPTVSLAQGDGGPILPDGYVGPMPSAKEPLSAETVTLRVAVPSNDSIGDWSTNAFTHWLEERSNVHVEWLDLGSTTEDVQTKVNVMIAAGDLPDIFMSAYFTPAQLLLYGSQGVFRPLNDLIDEHGVEIKRIFADYPDTRGLLTMNDGNIYSMPYVNDCYHCSGSRKLWINKAWLDTLGLAMPQTTEEFYEALKAFKEQDPNGNGQADEIPLMSATDTWQGAFDLYFMGSFLYNPGEPWLALDGEGKVDFVANKPGWREGLRFLNRLANDGLLAPESFSQTNEQLRVIGNNPDASLLGCVPSGSPGTFLTFDQAEGGRGLDYVSLPPLAGPDGTRIASWDYYWAVTIGNFVVTSACEVPDIAVKWGDSMYELEATLRLVHGVLGEDVRWAQEGEIGINGKQGVWKALVTWASEAMRNRFWNQYGLEYGSNDFRLGEVVDPEQPTFEKVLYDETLANYFPFQQDKSLQLPPLYLSEEQAGQVGEFATTINSQVKLAFAQFTLGEADVNDDGAWQDYVDTFEQMGLSQYLQIVQDAYDAKYGQ